MIPEAILIPLAVMLMLFIALGVIDMVVQIRNAEQAPPSRFHDFLEGLTRFFPFGSR